MSLDGFFGTKKKKKKKEENKTEDKAEKTHTQDIISKMGKETHQTTKSVGDVSLREHSSRKKISRKDKVGDYTPSLWYEDETKKALYKLLKDTCQEHSTFSHLKDITLKILEKKSDIKPQELAVLLDITLGEALILLDSIYSDIQ